MPSSISSKSESKMPKRLTDAPIIILRDEWITSMAQLKLQSLRKIYISDCIISLWRYNKDECWCVTIYNGIAAFNDMMDFDVFNYVWNNRFACFVIGFAIKCKLWKSFLMIKYRFYEIPNFIWSPDDSHWQNKQSVVTWSISWYRPIQK